MRRRLPLITVGLILLLAVLACTAAAANQAFSVSIQSPTEGTLLPVGMPSTVNLQASDPAGSGVVSVEPPAFDGSVLRLSPARPNPADGAKRTDRDRDDRLSHRECAEERIRRHRLRHLRIEKAMSFGRFSSLSAAPGFV